MLKKPKKDINVFVRCLKNSFLQSNFLELGQVGRQEGRQMITTDICLKNHLIFFFSFSALFFFPLNQQFPLNEPIRNLNIKQIGLKNSFINFLSSSSRDQSNKTVWAINCVGTTLIILEAFKPTFPSQHAKANFPKFRVKIVSIFVYNFGPE